MLKIIFLKLKKTNYKVHQLCLKKIDAKNKVNFQSIFELDVLLKRLRNK